MLKWKSSYMKKKSHCKTKYRRRDLKFLYTTVFRNRLGSKCCGGHKNSLKSRLKKDNKKLMIDARGVLGSKQARWAGFLTKSTRKKCWTILYRTVQAKCSENWSVKARVESLDACLICVSEWFLVSLKNDMPKICLLSTEGIKMEDAIRHYQWVKGLFRFYFKQFCFRLKLVVFPWPVIARLKFFSKVWAWCWRKFCRPILWLVCFAGWWYVRGLWSFFSWAGGFS